MKHLTDSKFSVDNNTTVVVLKDFNMMHSSLDLVDTLTGQHIARFYRDEGPINPALFFSLFSEER